MKLGLGRHMEGNRSIRQPRRTMAHLNTTESYSFASKLRTTDKLQFATHLAHNILLLLLCSTLQTFCHSLLRETLLIGAFYSITNIKEVFDHQQTVLRKERQERHLVILNDTQLRHDVYLLTLVLRQLTIHFKSADRVDIVAKEIDTERQLTAIGIDVEDATT